LKDKGMDIRKIFSVGSLFSISLLFIILGEDVISHLIYNNISTS